MNKLIVALCVAVLATAKFNRYSAGSGYQHQADVGEYHLQGAGHSNDSGSSTSADDAEGYSDHDGNGKNIPYQYVNTRDNSVSSLLTYPNNKGQILIHRPAAIIIKRPPTKVVVNHPPLVIKPAPVVLHKPPPVVMRRVFVKHHPRPVKVEPVYINVLKPPAEKYFMEEKQHPTLQPSFAPARVNTDFAPISDDADQNGDAEFDTSDIESASSSTNFYLLENH